MPLHCPKDMLRSRGPELHACLGTERRANGRAAGNGSTVCQKDRAPLELQPGMHARLSYPDSTQSVGASRCSRHDTLDVSWVARCNEVLSGWKIAAAGGAPLGTVRAYLRAASPQPNARR